MRIEVAVGLREHRNGRLLATCKAGRLQPRRCTPRGDFMCAHPFKDMGPGRLDRSEAAGTAELRQFQGTGGCEVDARLEQHDVRQLPVAHDLLIGAVGDDRLEGTEHRF